MQSPEPSLKDYMALKLLKKLDAILLKPTMPIFTATSLPPSPKIFKLSQQLP